MSGVECQISNENDFLQLEMFTTQQTTQLQQSIYIAALHVAVPSLHLSSIISSLSFERAIVHAGMYDAILGQRKY